MRSERETYLDVGSSAETDAGRGSGAEAPSDAGRSFSRSALVVLAALALACAAAAAAAVWTTPWGHPQSGAWESSELLRSFASSRALADQGTLTTDDVDAGSQMVAVQNSNLFKAGDDIILLDNSADPEVTEQGKVVLVEAPDTLVLKDALSYPYPRSSFVIVSNVDMPAPTHAPTQAPKPTPASAPAPVEKTEPENAVLLSGPRDAVDKGDPSDLWGGAAPSGMPQVPPQRRSKIAVRSRVVARPDGTGVLPPTLPDSNGTVFVFPGGIDGRSLGGGAKHEAMAPMASTVVSDHKHSIVVSDHEHGHEAAQGPSNLGGTELLGVVFAAVVCCAGCSVVGCYFCGPPGSAYTDWQADLAGRFAKLASGMRTAEGQRMPEDLVDELFQYLDADGNQFLDASELLVLAKHNGFQGTSTAWEQKYSRLAKIHFKENAKQGCTVEQFRKLIDDRSSGLYVNDEDINTFLDSMGTDE